MIGTTQLIFTVVLLNVYSVSCVGTAFIKNQCTFDVFVWSVADLASNPVNTLLPNDVYSETYRVNPNNGGISLKIATARDDTNITQFAYTFHPDDPRVFYDISNDNGYPFEDWGLSLLPSLPECPVVLCSPGVAVCPGADIINHCDVSADLPLTLCPSQGAQSITSTTTTGIADATIATGTADATIATGTADATIATGTADATIATGTADATIATGTVKTTTTTTATGKTTTAATGTADATTTTGTVHTTTTGTGKTTTATTGTADATTTTTGTADATTTTGTVYTTTTATTLKTTFVTTPPAVTG